MPLASKAPTRLSAAARRTTRPVHEGAEGKDRDEKGHRVHMSINDVPNIIRNKPQLPGNVPTRWECSLCGTSLAPQVYLFELVNPESALGAEWSIVCDECAEHPEAIPDRAKRRAALLRDRAEQLEFAAMQSYETDVVFAPEKLNDAYHPGYRLEDSFPDWMRERLGLPSRRRHGSREW